MPRWWIIAALVACGRVGFDPVAEDSGGGTPSDASDAAGQTVGDGAFPDGVPPTIACADMNLGSVLGPNVAAGSTMGTGNDYLGCGGDGPDITFGWFAPATASYQIDVCASAMSYDTVLSVRDGTCTGAQLGCADDNCPAMAFLQSRVTVSLTAGQGVVIILDSLFPMSGNYQLAITQL